MTGSTSSLPAAAARSSSSAQASTPAGCVIYFEIDDANNQLHAGAPGGSRIAVPVVVIAGNYVIDGLLRLLAANGFDFDLPTYVIWEGNTMYLTRPAVLGVLRVCAKGVGEFAISFDHMTEAVIVYATGDERTSAFVRCFADMARRGILASTILKRSPAERA